MDDRTRSYLRGRFGDYYRSATVADPPGARDREWGHIPWSAGGTTMVRHQSLLDLGELSGYLAREAPRHVYFSAARYDDPSAGTMEEKGWREADLVFDLDADHLPGVDPETVGYAEMLAECKEALLRLLDLLETDFGFDDLTVVFSGSRGYHVHVRDEDVRALDSEARREVVDYVRGIDLDVDGLVEPRPNETGTLRDTLRADGGWGRRVHEALLDLAADVRAADEESALERLQRYDGIGETTAGNVLAAVENNLEAIESGNLEAGAGGATKTLVKKMAREVVDRQSAPIDEPVTTDTRRLIRLPGSLHGGTGLQVRPLDRDAVDAFDPLTDAVPDRFTRRSITVDVDEAALPLSPDDLPGGRTNVSGGENTVEESVGVFLMARGAAEKVQE